MPPKDQAALVKERNEQKVRKYLPSLDGGRWELETLIGKGGNASVFRVFRKEGRTKIEKAVKLISIDSRHVNLDMYNTRLQRGEISKEEYQKNVWNELNDTIPELRFMALLSASPNVLGYENYLFFETTEDHQWNVLVLMELLSPLNRMLNSASTADILQMWLDMSKVLQLCAQFGVLHLDIKDANIMVDDKGRYKLIDWGLACYRSDIVRMVREHRSVRKGTESYMAPEVYESAAMGAYDERADQYSLGLVVYYYFNNMRLPFADKPWSQLNEQERTEIKRRRLSGAEPLPRPKDIPDDIWYVLQRACAHSPANRYPNAAEMVHAVELLIKKQPTPKKKLLIALIAVVVVVLAAGGFLMKDQIPELLASPTPVVTATPTPTPTPTPTFTPTPTPTFTPTPTPEPTPEPVVSTLTHVDPPLINGLYMDWGRQAIFTLSGEGLTSQQRSVRAGQNVLGTVDVGADGTWSMPLMINLLAPGENQMEVFDPAKPDDVIDTISIWLDTGVSPLQMQQDTVTDDMTSLSLLIEPWSAYDVTLNGESISSGKVGESGEIELSQLLLNVDDQIELHVTDEAGNTGSLTRTVVLGERAAIAMSGLPELLRPEDAAFLTLKGSSTPRRSIRLEWTLNGRSYSETVKNPGGDWIYTFDLSSAEHEEQITVKAAYEDGRGDNTENAVTLVFDGLCQLALDDDAKVVTERTTSISGTADVSASVRMRTSSSGYDLYAIAGEDGRFTFDGLKLAVGETVTLTAEDGLGNQAEEIAKTVSIQRELITMDEIADEMQPGELTISGTAEPHFEMNIGWEIAGEKRSKRVSTDASGKWTAVIDFSGALHGQKARVSVAYGDGLAAEMTQTDDIAFDAHCALSVKAMVYTKDTQLIEVTTDPNAQVTLSIQGGDSGTGAADGNGEISFKFSEGLPAGGSFTVAAKDGSGNEAEPVAVDIMREKITAQAEEPGSGYVTAGTIAVSGTAQPGQSVTAAMNDQRKTASADSSGAYAISFDTPANTDGVLTITVDYTDGKWSQQCRTETTVRVDNIAPVLKADAAGADLEVTRKRISGTVEPGSVVTLSVDGKEKQSTSEDGSFKFEDLQLSVGGTVRLSAVDKAGNRSNEISYGVIKEKPFIYVELEKSRTVEGKLSFGANVIKKGDIGLNYTIEQNGQVVYSNTEDLNTQSAINDGRKRIRASEMRDKNRQAIVEKLNVEGDFIATVYAVSYKEAVCDALGYGKFTLNVYESGEGWESAQPIASVVMENEMGEQDANANPIPSEKKQEASNIYTSDTVVFVQDELSVTKFNPKQVYLTGWLWKNRANETVSYAVTIDGTRYLVDSITAKGSSKKGFDRKKPAEAPADKNPKQGGVLMMLDLSTLKEGKHTILLEISHDSAYHQLKEYQITTTSSVKEDPELEKKIREQLQ